MDNRYKDRLFDKFPDDLGFVKNEDDPINIILNIAGRLIYEMDNVISQGVDNHLIDKMDPTLPSEYYELKVSFYDSVETPDIELNDDASFEGNSIIVNTEQDFRSNEITGLNTTPDKVINLEEEALGLSYGFGWREQEFYLTTNNDEDQKIYKYIYNDGDLVDKETLVNVGINSQSYDDGEEDEYLNFVLSEFSTSYDWDGTNEDFTTNLYGFIQDIDIDVVIDAKEYSVEYELTPQQDGTTELVIYYESLPSFKQDNDKKGEINIYYEYKYADLENDPSGDVRIFNIYDDNENLQRSFPEDEYNDDGDFILVGNRVILRNDEKYRSRYIAEYNYNTGETATYIDQRLKRHYIGKKGTPFYENS